MLTKVKPGESLVIPAETFNTFIDAALDFRRRQTAVARKPHTEQRHSDLILVKNASGADRDRFHILGLGEPLITPDYNEPEFQNRIALEGVSPTEADHAGRFAILLEPLKTDAIGMAMVAGVTVAKVDVQDEAHTFADVNDGQPASLKSAAVGSTQILWKEAGTGIVWAVVRLGVVPMGTHENPKVLSGTGDTADTETWDIESPPTDTDGVQVEQWFRLHWSGNSGVPVYQFARASTFDSVGRLVAISEEVRSVAFNTGSCE